MKWLVDFFTGGGFSSITEIAKEAIDTPLEKAQAQVLKLKVLDPRGRMREQISRDVTAMYKIYLMVTLFLIGCEFFGYGDPKVTAAATTKIVELFLPITSLFGVIVTASFGVNYANVRSEVDQTANKG